MAKGWIYLAGPIGGHTYDGTTEWREYATQQLKEKGIQAWSPMRSKCFLKGAIIDSKTYNETIATPNGITTRDRWDTTRCDIILMNLLDGEDIVSIGSMIEVGWSDLARCPIVMVCKKDGIYDKHPMLTSIIGFKTHDLNEGINIVHMLTSPEDVE